MTEIDSSLIEMEERVKKLEVSFNQLLNSNKNETSISELNLDNCKIRLPQILLP